MKMEMKLKIVDKFLGALAVVLLAGLTMNSALSQVIVPVGKTEQQSSQLILWYDEDDITDERFTTVQVTNASVDTPVWVHVQVFASTNTGTPGDPLTAVICAETDFNDFFTPNDTHPYNMGELFRNDPLNPTFVGSFEGTKGFVVVTPIDGPGTRNAIAHQHMFGVSYIYNFLNDDGLVINAMGRDAVSSSTGNVLTGGTVLDGSTNGYVLIQPEILKFNFQDNLGIDAADVVSIAFRDNYEGVFGYVAEPADAVWTPLIFDEDENPISCSAIPQNCFFDIGINDDLNAANTLLSDAVLCPGNIHEDGWVKIAVSGLEGLENELGIIALIDSTNDGYAFWMHVEGAATPITPPEEGACDDGIDGDGDGDTDCDDSECAGDPACVEGDCSDGIDGDEDGDTDCEDSDCAASSDCAEGGAGSCSDGVDNDEDGDTDCADADCAADPACFEGSCTDGVDGDGNGLTDCADPDCAEDLACVGGGGGGCAIAGTASAGSAAANALVLLIPLLGIGLRSILRRREED